jgi:Cupin
MDVLSEVLKAVKLDGAIFDNAEYSAPWCFRAPASHAVAPYLSPDPRHAWGHESL